MNVVKRRSAAVVAACVAILLSISVAEAQSGEIEVRLSARNAADHEVEFALQERNPSGEWEERILPRRRFFPDVNHTRWLSSSVIRLEHVAPAIVARIIARNTSGGSIEFGLQWALPGTRWGEQILPAQRFFPESDHTRWLNSSAVVIGPSTAATTGDEPIRTISVLASSEDGTGAPVAVTRYRLLGGERYVFSFAGRTTPTFLVPVGTTVFHESREFDHLETGYAVILIFPSGLELILHPDTVDSLLGRTDIADSTALSILESMRRSVEEERAASVVQSPQGQYQLRAPFPSTPLDFGAGSWATLTGAGTVSFRNLGRQLILTLPDGDVTWFILSSVAAEPHYQHVIYVVAAPEQSIAISWADGSEVARVVDPGPGAADLNALYDLVAASVVSN